jgi:alpha-galactosidase
VHIDGGYWKTDQLRDADGHIMLDPDRFTSSIADLAKYVHDAGLKFGFYTTGTGIQCDGHTDHGSQGREQHDAADFAAWGVDYLKVDNCGGGEPLDKYGKYANGTFAMASWYPAIKATKRPMILSDCHMGCMKDEFVKEPELCMQHANMWRSFQDIAANWGDIIGNNMAAQIGLGKYGKPGQWNDPDFLEVCNNVNFTTSMNRAHFSLWAVMSAPLMMGHNVIDTDCFDVLGNTEVIEANQLYAGNAGDTIKGNYNIFGKPLPNQAAAIVFQRALYDANTTADVTLQFADLEWETLDEVNITYTATKYKVRDLWEHKDLGVFTDSFTAKALPGQSVMMVKLTPVA